MTNSLKIKFEIKLCVLTIITKKTKQSSILMRFLSESFQGHIHKAV